MPENNQTILNETSINNMLADVYRQVNIELANYTKRIILETLGITIDSWGHVSSISDFLKKEIINIDKIEELKIKLISDIKTELISRLNTEVETKFYSKKIINQISTSIINDLNKQIIIETQNELSSKLTDVYIKNIKKSVYAIPQIQEIMLRKI